MGAFVHACVRACHCACVHSEELLVAELVDARLDILKRVLALPDRPHFEAAVSEGSSKITEAAVASTLRTSMHARTHARTHARIGNSM